MPKQTFTVKQTGHVVEIKRNFFWRNIVITLDGKEIGRFNSMRELKNNGILKTPIGDIAVEYKQAFFGTSGFEVWYNGEYLDGSLSDPSRLWRSGYQVALFIGVFNSGMGLLALRSNDTFLRSLGAGSYSLAFGIVLLLLGLWSWQRRSGNALALAAFIFGADFVIGSLLLLTVKIPPNIFMIMIRFIMIRAMWQGASAAWNADGALEGQPYEKLKKSY